MNPKPIMFAVSKGLLEHKDRMGPAVWEFLWFVDKVTEDIPDGNGTGKFNGLVLGGAPVSLERIARDLKEHAGTAKRNVKTLESQGYIVRHRLPENRCAYVVANSKKWFWRDQRESENAPTRGSENAPTHPDAGAKTLPAQEQECTRRESENAPAYKEDSTKNTTKNTSSSELESSSDVKSVGDGVAQKREKREPQKPSREADRLAQLLKDEILLNKADFRITPGQLRNWSRTADRMIRLDHRAPEAIGLVIRFAQRDEFWQPNILSMEKVREKFDQLELKRRANGKSHSPRREPPSRPDWAKQQESMAPDLAEGVKL